LSLNREEVKGDISDSEEDELDSHKNLESKNDSWGLILKIAIIIIELMIVFVLMTFLDAFIAFDLIDANPIVGFIKLIIFTLLVVNRLYRFGRLIDISTERINQIPILIPFVIFLGLIYVFPVMYMVTGVCICQVNEAIPGYVFQGKHVTTAWMRNQYEEVCPSSHMPCHVYATLPEDALTQAYITFHINQNSCFGQD
jgi:hypothetical protein